MIKFDVLSRRGGSVKFTAEIDCAEDAPRSLKLGLAIRWAISIGADLTDANLTRANLTGANLTGADLADADLADADLADADLTGADLTRADLAGADLTDANLTDADLTGADLTRADLAGANLTDADLKSIQNDFFDVLLQALPEVPAVLQALRDGKVDGSTYTGACACLVGTIAHARQCDVSTLYRNSNRPAERWFMGISPGHTPENNAKAKITEEWILEFMSLADLPTPTPSPETI